MDKIATKVLKYLYDIIKPAFLGPTQNILLSHYLFFEYETGTEFNSQIQQINIHTWSSDKFKFK